MAFEKLQVAGDAEFAGVFGQVVDGANAELGRVGAAHGQGVGVLETELAEAFDAVFFAQEFGGLGVGDVAVFRVLAFHQGGPDVAGVVDAAIDLVVLQGEELDRLAHPLALIDAEAGGLQFFGHHLRKNMLLGERSAGDDRRRRFEGAGDRPIQPAGEDEEQPGKADDRQAFAAALHGAFDEMNELIHDNREQGGEDAAEDGRNHVVHFEAGEDVVAEAHAADGSRQGRGADDEDGGGANAGDHDGSGERELDAEQHLPRGHAEPARRLGEHRIDAADADDGIRQDR